MDPIYSEENSEKNKEGRKVEESGYDASAKQVKTHTDLVSAHQARSLAISFRCQLLSKKSFRSRPAFEK